MFGIQRGREIGLNCVTSQSITTSAGTHITTLFLEYTKYYSIFYNSFVRDLYNMLFIYVIRDLFTF